jgi:hypothetical protein
LGRNEQRLKERARRASNVGNSCALSPTPIPVRSGALISGTAHATGDGTVAIRGTCLPDKCRVVHPVQLQPVT